MLVARFVWITRIAISSPLWKSEERERLKRARANTLGRRPPVAGFVPGPGVESGRNPILADRDRRELILDCGIHTCRNLEIIRSSKIS